MIYLTILTSWVGIYAHSRESWIMTEKNREEKSFGVGGGELIREPCDFQGRRAEQQQTRITYVTRVQSFRQPRFVVRFRAVEWHAADHKLP